MAIIVTKVMSSNEDAKLLVLLQMLNVESVGNVLVTADILTTTFLGLQGPLVLPLVNPSTRPLEMKIWMTNLQAYTS